MAFLFESSKTTILNNLGHCNAKPNKNMNGIRINSMINDWIRIRIRINSEFHYYRLETCVTWRYLHNEIQSIFQKKKRLTANRSTRRRSRFKDKLKRAQTQFSVCFLFFVTVTYRESLKRRRREDKKKIRRWKINRLAHCKNR